MKPSPVRRDRKFYTSLALHQAVQRHLSEDPERVVQLGIEGANRVLPHTRGGARDLVSEWLRLLRSRDVDGINAVLAGDDEYAVEMRNLGVFLGVLSEAERRTVLDEVYSRSEYAR
ncbi:MULTISPECIES: hypothetical protein [Bacteria]